MTQATKRVRAFVLLVALLSASACVDGAGPIPRDVVEVGVELLPGATETYEFDIEAEAFVGGESVVLVMSPHSDSLRSDGIAVEQSWTHEGASEPGWPDVIDVDLDERMIATLTLKLTNEGATSMENRLTITIEASGDIPTPSETDLRVEIHLR